jgi:hypothetical protein
MLPSRGTRRSDRMPCPRLLRAGAWLIAALSAAWLATPAGATTQTFLYTGAQQKFVVPPGVTSVHLLAVGARGGDGLAPGGGAGGAPAEVSGDIQVLQGQPLYVDVGGVGIEASFAGIARAFNGGDYAGEGTAGGGGASDVRLQQRPEPDTPAALFSRLIVAGGGGGGGAGSEGTAGGAGGQAGGAGASGVPGGAGGGAGTEETGGTGCAGGCNGKLGSGTQGSIGLAGSGGGGGGGGLFGGGGGASNGTTTGGGGGGGSSLQPAGGQTVVPAPAGIPPEVQITYTPAFVALPERPGPPPSASNVTNVFTLLRPIVGRGNSITLVLDLPGRGAATATATATREVSTRRHGRRVRRKVRITYGTARATATGAGALELTIKPSAAGRKALAAHKRLPVTVSVSFAPNGGKPASKHQSVTLPGR